MRRFGQVIRVRPEAIEEYERLHADPWPGVLAAIAAAHIRNYSIYRHGELLFAYYEYVGSDLEGDLAAMAADPIVFATAPDALAVLTTASGALQSLGFTLTPTDQAA